MKSHVIFRPKKGDVITIAYYAWTIQFLFPPRKANKEITKETGKGKLLRKTQGPFNIWQSNLRLSTKLVTAAGHATGSVLLSLSSVSLSPSPRGPAWSNAACPFFVRPKARFVCHTHTHRDFSNSFFFFLSLGSKLSRPLFCCNNFPQPTLVSSSH